MTRISPETLRELDAREMAVCRAGSKLDSLEASNARVEAPDYLAAFNAWSVEVSALMDVRKAILAVLSGA